MKNKELDEAVLSHPEIAGYLLAQNQNKITRYLHSIRYQHLKFFLEQQSNRLNQKDLSLFEIGCGYGRSLEVIRDLTDIKLSQYLGLNVEDQFSTLCQQRYGSDTHQFLTAEVQSYARGEKKLEFVPDVIISLECFEHIPEYDVPSIVAWLHTLNRPLFISVPNETGLAVLFKNLGSFLMRYDRYKEYTWKQTWQAFRYQIEKNPPHGTGHIGFSWQWLLSVLHQKFEVKNVGTSPWNFVPRGASLSLYFYCEPRN